MIRQFREIIKNNKTEYKSNLIVISSSVDSWRAETSPANIIYEGGDTTFNIYYRSFGKSEMIFKYDNYVIKLLFYSFSNNKYSVEKYNSTSKEMVNNECMGKIIHIYTSSELDKGKEVYKYYNLSTLVDELYVQIITLIEDLYGKYSEEDEEEVFKIVTKFKYNFIKEHQSII